MFATLALQNDLPSSPLLGPIRICQFTLVHADASGQSITSLLPGSLPSVTFTLITRPTFASLCVVYTSRSCRRRPAIHRLDAYNRQMTNYGSTEGLQKKIIIMGGEKVILVILKLVLSFVFLAWFLCAFVREYVFLCARYFRVSFLFVEYLFHDRP